MPHIAAITAHNFRRFTSLSIRNIPPHAKAVVLVGPNGSGKTAIFDAIQLWYTMNAHVGYASDFNYYNKGYEANPNGSISQATVDFYEGFQGNGPAIDGLVHARSAYRVDTDFSMQQISGNQGQRQPPRVQRLIDVDRSVSINYQGLVSNVVNEVFYDERNIGTVDFRDELIGDLRSSLQRVFPDLVLESLGRPLNDGSFFFTKGATKRFHYKNLSGGEKSVFDILLDLHVASAAKNNRVYLLDEPELHTNTRVQRALMDEIYRYIPNESQIWLSTHSLGMLSAARALHLEDPESVCFLSLYDADQDQSVDLEPIRPGPDFWKRAFAETLDEFSELIAPREVILCEGTSDLKQSIAPRSGFDSECLNRIFGNSYPESLFVSLGSNTVLTSSDNSVDRFVGLISKGTLVRRLIDRDDMTDQEIHDARQSGIAVLSKRELENYIFDDEIISKLIRETGGDESDVSTALQAVARCLAEVRSKDGARPDEVKAARQQIHHELKRIVKSSQLGKSADALCRDILAPLMTPDTQVYRELEACIWPKGSS